MLTKTLNVPSTMVAARMKSSEIVLSAIETHGQQMADFLGGKYNLHLEESQVMPFETQLRLFEKELIRLRDQLHQASRRNSIQKAREKQARNLRDAEVRRVNAKVGRARRAFSGVYDDQQMAAIGFSRRNARDADVLLEQAASLAANLEQPDLELITAPQLDGIDFNTSFLAQDIKAYAEQLQQSITDLRREERQSETAQFAKNDAMDEFNHAFLWIARSVESLLQLAGLEDQAARVRPSSRRPGVTERLETEAEGDEPVADGDTPEADGEVPEVEGDSSEPASEDPSSDSGTVIEP